MLFNHRSLPTIFDVTDVDDNLIIIDSHDLVIDQWLQQKQEQADQKEVDAVFSIKIASHLRVISLRLLK